MPICSVSSRQCYDDGKEFAEQALVFDQAGDIAAAIFYYTEAANVLLTAINVDPSMSHLRPTIISYIDRAEQLKKVLSMSPKVQGGSAKTEDGALMRNIEFLMEQAILEDEAGHTATALERYKDTAQLCLRSRSNVSMQSTIQKLSLRADQSLRRAEELTRVIQQETELKDKNTLSSDTGYVGSSSESESAPPTISRREEVPRSEEPPDTTPGSNSVEPTSVVRKLKPEEVDLLKKSSYINKQLFLPWMDSDRFDKFYYMDKFTDKNGNLGLADKQKKHFGGWKRITDISEEPAIVKLASAFSIRQTVVSDCSFVASLAVSAHFERRFKTPIITNIIYPQNRKGVPVVNPSGKYVVRLWLNGVYRKVTIDDYLPTDRHGDLLCSYSSNKNEFWVSLLEKAYMKVMGGYDFPGSSSNVDLTALTGWIPERVNVKRTETKLTDSLYLRMLDGHRTGDVLMTVATGPLSKEECDRTGLVECHAYAVLDLKNVNGLRMIQLKNPWCHLRWKGKYSPLDKDSWTPELQKALNFDVMSAIEYDNGVFWISWEICLHFFDVVYLNWNPKLFLYRYNLHADWAAGQGPKKDHYNLEYNPQYKVEVLGAKKPCTMWILLSRHITEKEDFANNKEFITLHVYKTNGDRVYYPDDALINGTKINSPHYLARLNAGAGSSTYTLVVSQYEKTSTISYSIRVFCTENFKIGNIPHHYPYEFKLGGEWTPQLAGGCPNYSTHKNNPTYALTIDPHDCSETECFVKLEAPKAFHSGFTISPTSDQKFSKTNSGKYRNGMSVKIFKRLPAGTYNIIPSTFEPGQCGKFFLTVGSTNRIKITRKG
ncbi:hypothetical protein ACHWQZ_G019477 [Mnemiopsis leidyi]